MGVNALSCFQSVSSTFLKLFQSMSQALKYSTGVFASPLLPSTSKRTAEAELVDRQLPCPVGQHCGGPVCAPPFCGLEACIGSTLCENTTEAKRSVPSPLIGRGFGCPDGVPCGHGPECAGDFCQLDACADAPLCQHQTEKRSESSTLASRRTACPQFCIDTEDGETLCGCAAEDYLKSHQANPPKA